MGTDGTPLSYNLFTYCKNNPITYNDPTGNFALVAAIIATGAIVGGIMGAITAATTGGNILESAIEGCITGMIGSACGLLIANPLVACAMALVGGVVTDLAVQTTSQYIANGTVDFSEIDPIRAIKTGALTSLGTAIPQYGNAAKDAIDAFGTALIWAEGSALITSVDIAVTNIVSTIQSSGQASPRAGIPAHKYQVQLM